ncbi:MAG: 30S ribosomal protein S3 [Patescibacteria group bacterium]|nr:30S ribosomal protein S3 [Patescibacteria group bacterium]
MGRKVNPKIFRLGTTQSWKSKWFSRKNYSKYLKQDTKIRKFLRNKLKGASVAKIGIERSANNITINIHTSKPGLVIGRGGAGADQLKKEVKNKVLKNPKGSLKVNITEVSQPNLNAEIVCQSVIEQIEKRIPFRRVMKRTLDNVMKAGAKGVKITVSGRLNGAEIARTEKLAKGQIPLHTLRADVDYSRGNAATTYGSIGVRVWIYKGEVFEDDKKNNNQKK